MAITILAITILAYVLLALVIGAGAAVVYQVRQNKQKIGKLEKSLDESLAEFADVLLTRVEATEHVIDSHYPNELEGERSKIQLEEETK